MLAKAGGDQYCARGAVGRLRIGVLSLFSQGVQGVGQAIEKAIDVGGIAIVQTFGKMWAE
jgi:hypothetical protein